MSGKHFGTPPRCGLILISEGNVLDIHGCCLPKSHQGPHEFHEHRTHIAYQWEYDCEYGMDVYWKKDSYPKLGTMLAPNITPPSRVSP
jgi:hypothetical protein